MKSISETSGTSRSAGEIALSKNRLTWKKRLWLFQRQEMRHSVQRSQREAPHGGRGRRTAGPQLVAYNERAESVGSLIAIFTASSNYWANTRNPRVNISFEEKKEKEEILAPLDRLRISDAGVARTK